MSPDDQPMHPCVRLALEQIQNVDGQAVLARGSGGRIAGALAELEDLEKEGVLYDLLALSAFLTHERGHGAAGTELFNLVAALAADVGIALASVPVEDGAAARRAFAAFTGERTPVRNIDNQEKPSVAAKPWQLPR